MNNNFQHYGRFGNLFFTGMAMHFIAEKNDLAMAYKQHDQFQRLGVEFFVGTKTYPETVELLDTNFFAMVKEPIGKNISVRNNVWCQTKEFSRYIREYFSGPPRQNILAKNIFRARYNQNEDVFVHVRLGDIANSRNAQPLAYYDTAIQELSFQKGFIASDSIHHPTCQALIKKYSLVVVAADEVQTIMFGSTCKYVVLSSGTFSWLIGLFAFFSQVYYPKIAYPWHGDIFVFDDWKEVAYNI